MITKIFKSVLTIFICFFSVQTIVAKTLPSKQTTNDSTAKLLSRTSQTPGPIDTTVDRSKATSGKTDDDLKETIVKDHYHYTKYGMSFIAGCVLILLLWFIKSRNHEKAKNSQRKSEIGVNNDGQLRDELMQNSINGLRREKQELQIRIDKLEEIKHKSKITIDELNGKIDDLQASQYLAIEPAVYEELQPVHNSSNYLYFPSPLSDGSFRKIDGKAQFLEGASIYRFNLISDTEASFEFCDESSSVSMALNNRSDLILSVAEEMEGASAGAKKILTYKGIVGQALLEDNKWIVIRKVQIKYG